MVVFVPKPGLTLVAVCRTGDHVNHLRAMLEFLHGQVLFLLTNKASLRVLPVFCSFSPTLLNGELWDGCARYLLHITLPCLCSGD